MRILNIAVIACALPGAACKGHSELRDGVDSYCHMLADHIEEAASGYNEVASTGSAVEPSIFPLGSYSSYEARIASLVGMHEQLSFCISIRDIDREYANALELRVAKAIDQATRITDQYKPPAAATTAHWLHEVGSAADDIARLPLKH